MDHLNTPLSWRRDSADSTDLPVPAGGDCEHQDLQEIFPTDLSGDEEPGFVALAYPFIKLSDNASVAEVDPLACGSISGLPIVYYNRPISDEGRVIFTIEGKRPRVEGETLMCKVGLTTCDPVQLKRYSFHASDVCKGGSLACRGWSICLPTFKTKLSELKTEPVAIIMEKQDAVACVTRLLTHFTDDYKTRAFRDKSQGGVMSSCPLYPFIILSGIVTRVRARSEPMCPTFTHCISGPFDAASLYDEEAAAKVRSPDCWLVADGIDVHSRHFFREANGLPLLVCKEPLTTGQQFVFCVSQVNEMHARYTLTIGYTTVDVSAIDLKASSPLEGTDWAEGWTVYPNVLPVVEKDDEISLRVAHSVIFIATQRYPSRPLVRHFPPGSHLFLYLTPNIEVIRLLQSAEKGEKIEEAGEGNNKYN